MKKINLPDFIEALKKTGIEFKQTPSNYFLLGPKYTYKIKKPVKFNFINLSTPSKRKYFCEEELKLNRRYSPSIYLKVIPIKKKDIFYNFGGKGKIIEYAIMMKTLPGKKRLDRLLSKNKVTPKMIKKIAQEIWFFHKKAKTNRKILAFGKPEYLQKNFEMYYKNTSQLKGKIISKNLFKKSYAFIMTFISLNRDLLLKRSQDKKIKDLHGDLRSENIFYLKKPYIFDSAVDPNLRYIDTAADITFLSMDLELRNEKDLAEVLLETYLRKSKDQDILKLLNFYKCYCAYGMGLRYGLAGNFKLAKIYFQYAGEYAQ